MKRDQSKRIDAMTMLAMAKARKRQDYRAVSYLVAAAIVVLGLGVVAWFCWPEDPPHVTLAAYDAAGVPDETISLRARAEYEGKERAARLDGLEFRFQVMSSQQAETVVTDALGVASLEWQAPKAEGKPVEFMVRHKHRNDPTRAGRDQGRVFIWPATANLLVVDIDHALADGIASLADGGSTAPALKHGAAGALGTLAARFKIVYVTEAVNRPTSYRKLRTWLRQSGAMAKGQLPDGPLLGPTMPVGEGDEAIFRRGQMQALKKSFPGQIVGVAGRNTDVQMYLDAGWKAIMIGGGEAVPHGAVAVIDWAELPKKLAP